MEMINVEVFVYALAGMTGGMIRAIVTGEGSLILPRLHERRLDLGSFSSMIVGAIAGVVAPYAIGVNSVIAFVAGYVGNDVIENLAERGLGKRARPGHRA